MECCAQALPKLSSATAANSTFPMLPPLVVARKAAIVPRGMQIAGSGSFSGELEMIRTLIAMAVAGAFALPVAAPASAADDMAPDKNAATGMTRGDRFDQLDKNHDGFICATREGREELRHASVSSTRTMTTSSREVQRAQQARMAAKL
jgi:hypothetical protein